MSKSHASRPMVAALALQAHLRQRLPPGLRSQNEKSPWPAGPLQAASREAWCLPCLFQVSSPYGHHTVWP